MSLQNTDIGDTAQIIFKTKRARGDPESIKAAVRAFVVLLIAGIFHYANRPPPSVAISDSRNSADPISSSKITPLTDRKETTYTNSITGYTKNILPDCPYIIVAVNVEKLGLCCLKEHFNYQFQYTGKAHNNLLILYAMSG